MNNIINIKENPEHPAIEDEARAWVIRLDGARPSQQDINEFREWLNRSPMHKHIFKRIADVWVGMDGLAGRYFSVLETATAIPEQRSIKSRFKPIFITLATAVAVLIVVAGLYLNKENLHAGQYNADYATVTGEIRKVDLPDGSEIQLNTGSKVNIDYENNVRNVYLMKGEAHFRVEHDTAKPFIVYAGKYAVKAVGTAFNIFLQDGSLDLTVTHGRVEVSSLKEAVLPGHNPSLPKNMNQESLVPFVEGQHVVMDQEIEMVQKLTPDDIRKKLSWRDGLLVFDAEKLEDVVSRINRYIPSKIVISDPALADIKFGGHFKVGEINTILSVLEEQFGIRVERTNNNLIYLSRKSEGRNKPPQG